MFACTQKFLLDGVRERNQFRHDIQQTTLLMVY
jgi:hypothetical protein